MTTRKKEVKDNDGVFKENDINVNNHTLVEFKEFVESNFSLEGIEEKSPDKKFEIYKNHFALAAECNSVIAEIRSKYIGLLEKLWKVKMAENGTEVDDCVNAGSAVEGDSDPDVEEADPEENTADVSKTHKPNSAEEKKSDKKVQKEKVTKQEKTEDTNRTKNEDTKRAKNEDTKKVKKSKKVVNKPRKKSKTPVSSEDGDESSEEELLTKKKIVKKTGKK